VAQGWRSDAPRTLACTPPPQAEPPDADADAIVPLQRLLATRPPMMLNPLTTRTHLDGLRVLHVEDDPLVAGTVQELLEAEGCQVLHTHDGIIGQLIAAHTIVDLLLTDLDLPGLDGARLIRLVRAWRPWMPVLVFTGSEQEATLGLHRPREGPLEVVFKAEGTDAMLRAVWRLTTRRRGPDAPVR
jgi:CheY-like chemotaxis protein